MLKLEEILCREGLNKEFYHEGYGETKFKVVTLNDLNENPIYILMYLLDETEWEFVVIGSDLLDGYYTKD